MMIPKKIHYCWFGRGEKPQLAKDCIDSWHKRMDDSDFRYLFECLVSYSLQLRYLNSLNKKSCSDFIKN